MGQRAFDGLAASVVARIDAVVSCDAIASATAMGEVAYYSLESGGSRRQRWTSADVAGLGGLVTDACRTFSAVMVVPYAASVAFESLGTDDSLVSVAGINAALQSVLDDKRNNVDLFSQLDLPSIGRRSADAVPLEFEALSELLGCPFIIRTPFGSAGGGVVRVSQPDHLGSALQRYGGEQLLFESYVDGVPVNVNAVVFASGTATFNPSVQITGVPECTDLEFGFCGNDFSAARHLGSEALDECRRQTEAIGDHLADSGYRGMVGVDFIVSEAGDVYPLEINPRFQNSTAIVNLMSRSQPEVSPIQMHLDSFDMATPRELRIECPDTLNQLILYAERAGGPSRAGSDLVDGLYNAASLELIDEDLTSCPVLRHGEAIISGLPLPNAEVDGGATLGKVVSSSTFVESDHRTISRPWAVVADAIRRRVVGVQMSSYEGGV